MAVPSELPTPAGMSSLMATTGMVRVSSEASFSPVKPRASKAAPEATVTVAPPRPEASARARVPRGTSSAAVSAAVLAALSTSVP